MQRRRFDLIVFDWDGTLADSTAVIVDAIRAAARDCGVAVPSVEQASYVIGMGLRDALSHAVPELPASRYGELAERYRFHYLRDEQRVSLFDGVPELLDELRARGFRLAVATGKSRAGLDRALASAGLQRLFEVTRTADETRSKPHPLMLEQILDATAAARERSLMVGDTTHDLLLARNAGVAGGAVAYGAHEPQPLIELQPAFCVHSVAQLRQWLVDHG
jgi:phosphoglycolate phosphatase